MLTFKDEKDKKDLVDSIEEMGYNYLFLLSNVSSDEFCNENNSTMHRMMFLEMMKTFAIFLKKIGVDDFATKYCKEDNIYSQMLYCYHQEDFISTLEESYECNKKMNIDQYLYAVNCLKQEPEKIDHTKDTIYDTVYWYKKTDDNEPVSQKNDVEKPVSQKKAKIIDLPSFDNCYA